MILSKDEIAFFNLYKSGLWQDVNGEAFDFNGVDWRKVISYAGRHGVSAILCDGVFRTGSSCMPRPYFLNLCNIQLDIEKQNKVQNAVIKSFYKFFIHKEWKAWLQKGQGVALCYGNPLRRTPGDIDFYFPHSKDYDEARRWVLQNADKFCVTGDSKAFKHFGFYFKSQLIEFHGTIKAHVNKTCKNNFPSVEQAIGDEGVYNEQLGVMLPPVMFDALFIFVHMARHYFGSGIGLRQITDWMLFMNAHREEIDFSLLKEYLDRLGVSKIWQVFSVLCVDWLACPMESMPFYDARYKRHAERVLHNIIKAGDAAQTGKKATEHALSYYAQRLKAFTSHLRTIFLNVDMFPEETLSRIPRFIEDGLSRTHFRFTK